MGSDSAIAVTGASGQVGRALRPLLPRARFLAHEQLDVTDREAVKRVLGDVQTVIHAAAVTDVDACERAPELAFAVNAVGTRHVVDVAPHVIFLSSDHVFDGNASRPYCEDDEPAPVNVYGRSKRDGERYVLERPGNIVVRTSWVYGAGRNFVRTIVEAGRAGHRLVVVDDQRGRPTPAAGLARALVELLRSGAPGIIHFAGDGSPCSRAELAEAALERAGIAAEVERVGTSTYLRRIKRNLAPRPLNGVLCLHKARALGLPLEDWRTSVNRYVGAIA